MCLQKPNRPSGGKSSRLPTCAVLGNAKRMPINVPSLSVTLGARGGTGCPHCTAAFHTLGVFRLMFELFGFRSKSLLHEEALLRELPTLHRLSEKRELTKYLKYKLAACFSWSHNQEMPAWPGLSTGSVGWKFVGGGYLPFCEIMKRALHCPDEQKRRKAASFFATVLALKKGLPRPSRDDCLDAVVKAYETMTKPIERLFSDHLAISEVIGKAKEVVKKLFRPEDWTSVELLWPSAKSHYGAPRRVYGAASVLGGNGFVPDLLETDWQVVPTIDGETQLRLQPSGVKKLVEGQEGLVAYALQQVASAIPQALPEPLKIRTVTSGDALLYSAIRPIQRVLYRSLIQDERFQIKGDINGETVGRILGSLPRTQQWVSGDYSAATDNLAIEISHHVVNAIADRTRMPDAYRVLFQRALTEHWYTMNTGGPHDPVLAEFKAQARGQLMGSPVSFPILCIANFALIWASNTPNARFEDVRTIVNGDDCLFPANKAGYRRWQRMARSVGLEPSVGKTYYSREFYVINSTYFDYRNVVLDRINVTDDVYVTFEVSPVVPFLNFGLLIGLKRSGDRETSTSTEDGGNWSEGSVGARAQKLFEGFTDDNIVDRSAVLVLFLELNKHCIHPSVPRFLPVHLGGYGLPTYGFGEGETDELWGKAWTAVFALEWKRPAEPDAGGSPESRHHQIASERLGQRFGWKYTNEPWDASVYNWHVFKSYADSEETDSTELEKFWVRVRALRQYTCPPRVTMMEPGLKRVPNVSIVTDDTLLRAWSSTLTYHDPTTAFEQRMGVGVSYQTHWAEQSNFLTAPVYHTQEWQHFKLQPLPW